MQSITQQLLGQYSHRIVNAPQIYLLPSLQGMCSFLLEQVGRFNNPLLVADENTYLALGKKISGELAISQQQKHIFVQPLHAELFLAQELTTRATPHDVIIGVGSGTINDLCKYAAHQCQIPYVIFPTAPSMNGYVSANASLIKDGLKQSFVARMPAGVFCDLETLSNAPYRLIRSGLGDTFCRSTVQADWMLSHILLDTAYDETPFSLIRPYEDKLISQAGAFITRDSNAIMNLMEALLIGGFAMVMCEGSHPASQGEHMIAHTFEMLFPRQAEKAYHGEHIAVTTLLMDQLQCSIIDILSNSKPNLFLPSPEYQTISTQYGHMLKMSAYTKKASPENTTKIKQFDHKKRDFLLNEIQRIQHPAGALLDMFVSMGIPTVPEDIGCASRDYIHAMKLANYSRDRFTFLDLMYLENT